MEFKSFTFPPIDNNLLFHVDNFFLNLSNFFLGLITKNKNYQGYGKYRPRKLAESMEYKNNICGFYIGSWPKSKLLQEYVV